MKTQTFIVLFGLASLTACSQAPTKAMPTEPVAVVQDNDMALSCIQLEPQVNDIQFQTAEMIKLKQERQNSAFGLNVLVNMTLSFLSPATAGAHNSVQNGFTHPEMARLESLKQRHAYLLSLADNKKCGFSKALRAKMDATYSSESERSVPTGRQRLQD